MKNNETDYASERFVRNIGENVAAARNSLGWTQEKLAQKSQLGRSVVAKIESYHSTSITVDSIFKLSLAFGIPPYLLMLGKQDWKRLQHLASATHEIDTAINRYKPSTQSIDAIQLEEMASSPLKRLNRLATQETTRIIAEIFQLGGPANASPDVEVTRKAATAMANGMIPASSIFNGIIAHMLSA